MNTIQRRRYNTFSYLSLSWYGLEESKICALSSSWVMESPVIEYSWVLIVELELKIL